MHQTLNIIIEYLTSFYFLIFFQTICTIDIYSILLCISNLVMMTVVITWSYQNVVTSHIVNFHSKVLYKTFYYQILVLNFVCHFLVWIASPPKSIFLKWKEIVFTKACGLIQRNENCKRCFAMDAYSTQSVNIQETLYELASDPGLQMIPKLGHKWSEDRKWFLQMVSQKIEMV